MLIGYMRVSKADGSQSTHLQRDAQELTGVDPKHIYADQASGKRQDHPGLATCIKALREGDTLAVWKLDRLGRDLRHLIDVRCRRRQTRQREFTDVWRHRRAALVHRLGQRPRDQVRYCAAYACSRC